ncbi:MULTISPECIES: cytochrome-c peroxidase [unclassified Phyllobacterium]|uniref:cytochrome-c peroxidase n=1 Tax=unclassified Phyllobacterium TaxID=2638441 RepID=UPI003012EAF1
MIINAPAQSIRVVLKLALAVAVIGPAITITTALSVESRDSLSPLPAPSALNMGKVELGRKLFHDPILSKKQTLSCSTCHDLAAGGTVHSKRTTGYDGKMHEFNSTTVFNVGNNYRLGWRGRFTSLTLQNEKILLDENLMANSWEVLLPRLNAMNSYSTSFQTMYGVPPNRENVLDALSEFQRSLSTPNAPFDLYLMGDSNALDPQQKRGYELFLKIGCVSCHQGSNIGGNMFQLFGVFANPSERTHSSPTSFDWQPSDLDGTDNIFRVPSLRNVEVTAPYFHDGSADTLAEAVAVMGKSQLGRELTDSDIKTIVEFLKSLTGEYNGERLKSAPVQPAK